MKKKTLTMITTVRELNLLTFNCLLSNLCVLIPQSIMSLSFAVYTQLRLKRLKARSTWKKKEKKDNNIRKKERSTVVYCKLPIPIPCRYSTYNHDVNTALLCAYKRS